MPFSETLKTEVRRKAHHSCCVCKQIGVEVHHVIPESEAGEDTFENAAPLCPSCHETYGANPTKRKVIREMRDQWYEICTQRYTSDLDRLNELKHDMEYLRRTLDVETIKYEISDAVIQRLRDAGLLTLSVGWGWPIGKLMQRIYDFPREFALQQSSTLQIITEMLFHTTGDRRRNFDREYNTTRDAFVSEYGSSGAKGLCAYLVRKHKLDFDEGVTEEELQDVILSGLIHMILLLMHEDVTHKETKLAIQFTEDFQFRAKVVRDKPI